MTNEVVSCWGFSRFVPPHPRHHSHSLPVSPSRSAFPHLLSLLFFLLGPTFFFPLFNTVSKSPFLAQILLVLELRQPEALHITLKRGWLKKGVSLNQLPGAHMPVPPTSLLQEHPLPRPHTTSPKLHNSHSSSAEPCRQQHNTPPPYSISPGNSANQAATPPSARFSSLQGQATRPWPSGWSHQARICFGCEGRVRGREVKALAVFANAEVQSSD